MRVGGQGAQLAGSVLLQQRQPGGVVAARDLPLQAAAAAFIFVITLTVFSSGSFLIATGSTAVAAAPPVARHLQNRARWALAPVEPLLRRAAAAPVGVGQRTGAFNSSLSVAADSPHQ